jgi:hypothetical protein
MRPNKMLRLFLLMGCATLALIGHVLGTISVLTFVVAIFREGSLKVAIPRKPRRNYLSESALKCFFALMQPSLRAGSSMAVTRYELASALGPGRFAQIE